MLCTSSSKNDPFRCICCGSIKTTTTALGKERLQCSVNLSPVLDTLAES